MNASNKRIVKEETKKGIGVTDLILIAVLLAAGAVLKFFIGSFVNIGGMKPNFIIAMYCLAIMLIKPKLYESAIIGLLAGVLCQLFPGTPYLNLISETAGALAMSLLVRIPIRFGRFDLCPVVSSFAGTLLSGSVFVVCLFAFTQASASAMVAYIPIVLCTAVFNAVIVQALYVPVRVVLERGRGRKNG